MHSIADLLEVDIAIPDHTTLSRRKLRLGMDAVTHEIVAVELTRDELGDVSEIPDLHDQIDADVASLTADGAYDGEAVYDAVADRHPEAAIIIPPRATAVPSETTTTQRDQHIAEIEKHGRIGWERRSGYNRRSLVETGMYRYKAIVGRRLHARTLPNQRTESKIGCNVLNRMRGVSMTASARIR
jgi:transposase